MRKYDEINSTLDALKLKAIEKSIYNGASEENFILPKVIPFKGINTDFLFINNNRPVFVKCMDTTEELFSFLDEEILEVMNDEHGKLKELMNDNFPDIDYSYVFLMPYIEFIDDKYGMDDFIDNYVIFGKDAEKIFIDRDITEKYLPKENEEIALSMFLYRICPEYFAVSNGLNLNENMKILNFSDDNFNYRMAMVEEEQMVDIDSIVYGNHIILGGSGSGKSTVLLGRLIKLSKIYPHHKFLLLTFSKQQYNKYREILEILNVDTSNIIVNTFSSFIFKIAKINKLVIDYSLLKKNYDKVFANIMKQIENSIKNKKMFKGIFIDEVENFSGEEIKLINEFLYSRKNIFNIAICKAYNINNSLNIYKCKAKSIEYEDELYLKKNYRQSRKIGEFINRYCDNANSFIAEYRDNIPIDVFQKTEAVADDGKEVNIIRVEDLDDQINAVIWEVQHLVNDLGFSYEDIAVVYPFNKKKLKNGNIIYFQYMLRKALDDVGIEYVYADDTITDITPKSGITISNIYSIKSLSYKAVVLCELEMLYNHSISGSSQDYHINDFVGDLNKVYTAMTRSEEYLSIIISYSEESSDIIRLLNDSMNK